jgi:hypothetical protein
MAATVAAATVDRRRTNMAHSSWSGRVLITLGGRLDGCHPPCGVSRPGVVRWNTRRGVAFVLIHAAVGDLAYARSLRRA